MRLIELLQTSSGGHPPVLTDPGDDGGPKGGKYWLHGRTKVVVDGDFATMVFRFPQEFGFSHDDLLHQVGRLSDERTVQAIKRDLQKPDVTAFSWFGARMVGVNILLERAWGFVEYDTNRLGVWVSKPHLAPVIAAIGKQFPLMQLAGFSALVMQPLWTATPGGQTTVKFDHDDYPGVAGMFSAIMHWVRTGEIPQQSWYYVLTDDLATVKQHGLVASGPTHFMTGNWTNRNVYLLNFMPDSLWYRAWGERGTVVRFPPAARPATVEAGRNDDSQTMVLYSKQPFQIASDQVQVKHGGYWRSLT